MQKRRLRNSLAIFITLLLFSTVYAKDGEGHSWDMLGVLGLYSSTDLSKSYANLSSVQSLFTKVNDYCDKLNVTNSEGASDNYYNQLKEEFNFFTYEQKYTHRQIYHWGFDFDKDLTSEGIPSDNQIPEALKKTFEKKFVAMYGDADWLVSEWYRFLKFIIPEQAKRNASLISYINSYFKLHSTSDSRDIAAILYYTHLLGDHIVHEGEHSGEAVLELKKIEKNLDTHVKNLSRKCDWIYTNYSQSINRIASSNDRDRAKSILKCLQTAVPSILQYKYANEFTAKNLIFCFDEDFENAA